MATVTSLQRRLLNVFRDGGQHNLGTLMGLVNANTGRTVTALRELENGGYIVKEPGGWRLA